MLKPLSRIAGALGLLALAACGPQGASSTATAPAAAHPESADEFVARVNKELEALSLEQAAAGWMQQTYITKDTELLSSRAQDRFLAYVTQQLKEAKRFDGQTLSPATARALMKLRLSAAAPAPDDPVKRARLTALGAELDAKYGEGKYCPKGPQSCRNLDQLSDILAKNRNYAELTDAWKGWHDV